MLNKNNRSIIKNRTVGGSRSKTYTGLDFNGILLFRRRTLHVYPEEYRTSQGEVLRQTDKYYLTEELFAMRLSTLKEALEDINMLTTNY